MARMFNMAQDWTYDLFVEDAKLYKATPIKGVHCSERCSERQKFMVWLKGIARDFREEWGSRDYNGYRYIGDAFEEVLREACFSDYYKEVYGQRPHLPRWYYIHMLELPMMEDVGRLFCASPIAIAMSEAKRMRTAFEEEV